LQGTQVPDVIAGRVSRLELDEKFECCLIRLPFQTLNHFRPMIQELILAPAARLISQTSVLEVLDDDATCTSMLPPALDAPVQRAVLPQSKLPRELSAAAIYPPK
jgi:hypothetical protein